MKKYIYITCIIDRTENYHRPLCRSVGSYEQNDREGWGGALNGGIGEIREANSTYYEYLSNTVP